MKIAVYDPYLDTLSGGERYMLSIASALSDKHDVFVLWDDKDILIKAERKLGVKLTEVKVHQNIFADNFNFFKRIIYTLNFDYIFFLSDGSLPILLSKKSIIHFQFPVEWVKYSIFSKMKIKTYHKIICNSNFTKEHIDRKFKYDSRVIYPPVKLIEKTSEKKNIILTVGRYNKSDDGDFKRLEFMAEIFKEMLEKGLSGWEFCIVTSSTKDNKKDLDVFVKKYSKDVKFFIDIDKNTLEDIYCKSKIYWHAAGYNTNIEKNPELSEHFGITTVEAMSAACVPVVFCSGGQKEIVDDKKDGFFWKQKNELIQITMNLIQDEDLLKKISENSSDKAKKFSDKYFEKEIQDLIR